MKKDKPWLDDNGEMRPDVELKNLGKHWSQDTWRRYFNAYSYWKRMREAKLNREEQGGFYDGWLKRSNNMTPWR